MTESNQKPGLPTLHHLNVSTSAPKSISSPTKHSQDSQSQRILWLLEEIGVNYNLVLHKRNPKTRRSPPSLQEIHPLGKAPTFVTEDGTIIVESAAIAGYIIRTYDKTGKHASADILREETLSAFSGSSIHVWVSFALTFDLLARNTPWPASYLSKGLEGIMKKQFITAELKKSLEYLEGELGAEEWFNGKAPGRPDILLSYPLEQIIQRGYVDVDKEYPRLGAWRGRILNSPAWKRGIEKGNGFDLLNL